MKVSTRRELRTFSSAFCELSGSMVERPTAAVDEEWIIEGDGAWNCELADDTVELVRGRFEGLTDGDMPVEENARPVDPTLAPCPRLPPLEKLTFEPFLILPRCNSGLPTKYSSFLPPSSDCRLRKVLSEFAEILRLRLRPSATSRSSDR